MGIVEIMPKTKTATQILKRIAGSHPYPINLIVACSSGVCLGMTDAEYDAYEHGELVFKTKYENKTLIRETGGVPNDNIPDFPWNKDA